MKRLITALLIVFLFLLTASYCKSVTNENRVFVANTFENLISSVFQPKNWINWNNEVQQAWLSDSSTCRFATDTTSHISSIDIPGKKIRITQLNYLLYQVEEIKNNKNSAFSFSIIPYVGNGQPRSEHNSRIIYTEKSNLLYHLFPFLEKNSFAEKIIDELGSYLENNARFYGFPIELKKATDTLFLTQRTDLAKRDLFKKLPGLFEELEKFAKENQCRTINKNISFDFLNNDSLSVLAGINIDKIIPGDYLHNFMQLPAGQVFAAGYFEGPFGNRHSLYLAMKKYLFDHQLIRAAACYEKYLSPLPVSDSSMIKMELLYPLRY
jgi:effector-binding domain-containing protein